MKIVLVASNGSYVGENGTLNSSFAYAKRFDSKEEGLEYAKENRIYCDFTFQTDQDAVVHWQEQFNEMATECERSELLLRRWYAAFNGSKRTEDGGVCEPELEMDTREFLGIPT